MSRRIEIELTSQRSESEWTWRAAGAKLPKGSLDARLLYDGAKVGDVTKAEAEFEIDGINIIEVFAPKGKRSESPEAVAKRIEVKGSDRKFEPVTSQLAPKGRGRNERSERKPRGDRHERSARHERPSRQGERPASGRGPRREPPRRTERPAAPAYKKLNPRDDFRRDVLNELAPEHRPIAEQVLRGGIPAVRQAIEVENAKAKEEGRPELHATALIAVAEELLPRLKAAEWMDRAQAAKTQADEISVRDLRAVVAGADAVARTDQARVLAAELREVLDRRTQADRENWVKEIATALDEGRTVRALRLSSRPPDAQTKFPAELQDRLKAAAEEALSPDTAPDRWITLLDAVANSPVRRAVEPKGLPAEPGDELLTAAKQASGRIPALAKMLGVSIPPPPTRKPPPKPAAQSEG